jgi:hypothetical protein
MAHEQLQRPSLYRRAIGPAFDRLPAVLCQFHDLPCGGCAEGTFRVTRGPGMVRDALATIMKLPRAGEKVAVTLRVTVSEEGERWVRHFDSQVLTTRQWIDGDLLYEAAGPLQFGFRMSVEDGRMLFDMQRCRVFGAPVPFRLAPRVSAVVEGRDTVWHACVEVSVPLLGLLVRYEGEMSPSC